jgi:hypothetical protein
MVPVGEGGGTHGTGGVPARVGEGRGKGDP